MEKKKVLITYATYGSGHKTVANYIYDYFCKNNSFEVKIIDLLNYENKIGKISTDIFNLNFKTNNSIGWDLTYELFDHKATASPFNFFAKAIIKKKKLQQDIQDFNPDILISTHFFGASLLSYFNHKGYTHAKIITIITDYISHEFWIKNDKDIDAFIVSNNIVKNDLISRGVNKKKIYPYGIPISSEFRKTDDINIVKTKYHVNNKKKTILFFAGGSAGSSNSFIFLKRILKERYDINIMYLTGNNSKLKLKAEEHIKEEGYKNVSILGFSKDIKNLLNIADIVITKPGGVSITEALEMKKPLLLIPGNGGQERYNAKFICWNGFGFNSRTTFSLNRNLKKLLTKKNVLANMNNKLIKYQENTSVDKIYKLVDKLLKK